MTDHAAGVLQDVASRLHLAEGTPPGLVRAPEVDPVVDEPEPLVWPPVRQVTDHSFGYAAEDCRDVGGGKDLG
jgi:hypothetical protein